MKLPDFLRLRDSEIRYQNKIYLSGIYFHFIDNILLAPSSWPNILRRLYVIMLPVGIIMQFVISILATLLAIIIIIPLQILLWAIDLWYNR